MHRAEIEGSSGMNEPFNPVRLSQLVTNLADGQATADERREFEELLTHSEAARRFYVLQMLQRALLIQDAGFPVAMDVTGAPMGGGGLQRTTEFAAAEAAGAGRPGSEQHAIRKQKEPATQNEPSIVKSPVLGF
jgi:hypothetical protein